MRQLYPLAAAVLVMACAATARRAPLVEFSGRYTAGFEVSRFFPCDVDPGDGPWWVILSAAALGQRDSLVALLPASAGAEAFVRWRGVAGDPAPAGHLGQSTRYLHVAEILELRPVVDTDCRADGRRRSSLPPAT